VFLQGALSCNSSSDGVTHTTKYHEYCVSVRVNEPTAVGTAGADNEPTVVCKELTVLICPNLEENACRALDVGEKHHHGAGGQPIHATNLRSGHAHRARLLRTGQRRTRSAARHHWQPSEPTNDLRAEQHLFP
jgi:hypothetical protein